MAWRAPSKIGGYVLAGGKSSRMGRDKALLELAGKPLALHAVVKLRRVCEEVSILSNNPELDAYAPLVPDLHEACGPLGGIEAGLAHSRYDWNLFMPVDMPFLPSAFLDYWIRKMVLAREQHNGARIAMFRVEDAPQPALCLLHRDVAPYISEAMGTGRYKTILVLEEAARDLARRRGGPFAEVIFYLPWDEMSSFSTGPRTGESEAWWTVTEAQQAAKKLWFVNLNTPEDFGEAEQHVGALDT
ncbi:MAG TPA: molybdenum cofactor guanylyltransferase [Edaphobacter sp.]